jgi:hypothetical protein
MRSTLSRLRIHWSSIWRSILVGALTTAMIVLVPSDRTAEAQAFTSGSTGADGPLDFSSAAPGTVIEFNPASANPPLDPERDNVYNFTTITIPTGVTVRLTARFLNGPVFWLATGSVQINGTIDLNGANGHLLTTVPAGRVPSIPGAGGFGGGIGGYSCTTNPALPQAGNGPSGGGPGRTDGNGAAGGGGFSGNQFLVPLVGGSGGGGGSRGSCNEWGPGGGAGAGALLIASSTSIVLNGVISAVGGHGRNVTNGDFSAGGGGGAIRLIAATISGTGSLSAVGGGGNGRGGNGRVRLEAFQNNFTGNIDVEFARSSPTSTFLPTVAAPVIRVVSVAGVPVPANPTGAFDTPDVNFNDGAAVPVAIEARNVPPGTVVKVHVFSENGPDQIVDSSGLQGTLTQSTAIASVVFPPGFSRGFVRAVWR